METYSRNRLAPFKNISKAVSAFSQLTELQLNGTLMTWQEAEDLVLAIPSLRIVEMGYNRLSYLSPRSTPSTPNIQTVNLDSNELDDWTHICRTFKPYHTYVLFCVLLHQ